MLARNGERPRYFPAALWLSVFAVSFAVGGLAGMGAVLAIAFIVQVGPSICTAYRSSDLHGASLTTGLLTGTEGALWGLYGSLSRDTAVIAFGPVALVASLAMVFRIRWAINRRSADDVSPTAGALVAD